MTIIWEVVVVDKKEQKLLKIGDLAKKAGVTVRTVRYYEELGLLSPTETSAGGFRLYSEDDLRKLIFVKRFKELDFPLEEIQQLIDMPQNNLSKSKRISLSLSLLQKQLEQVENQIKKSKVIKKEIEKAIRALNDCSNCKQAVCISGCPNKQAMI